MATRRKKAEPRDALTDTQLHEAERRVREKGSIALNKLVDEPLTRNALLLLLEALARRGLEKTTTVVRVPVLAQIEALVKREEFLALKGLRKRLSAGCTETEIKRAIAQGVAAKSFCVVVREAGDALTRRQDVLAQTE